MKASFWVRHGWRFLLALVVIIGLFGIGDLIFGLDADPAIVEGVTGRTVEEVRQTTPEVSRLSDLQVRAGGIQLIVIGVLWVMTVLGPFRRGDRWGWWAMWTFPAWALAVAISFLFVDLVPSMPIPPPAVSGWVFAVLGALLLMATRRGFLNRS